MVLTTHTHVHTHHPPLSRVNVLSPGRNKREDVWMNGNTAEVAERHTHTHTKSHTNAHTHFL